MPKEIPRPNHERLTKNRETDEDPYHIAAIDGERYVRTDGEDVHNDDEYDIDPEELAGGLGPKGSERAKNAKKR